VESRISQLESKNANHSTATFARLCPTDVSNSGNDILELF